MMRKIIKDYFSFTKKERVGVIVLVFVIIVIFIVPYLLPEQKESLNKSEWEEFRNQSARLLRKQDEKQIFTDKARERYPARYDRERYPQPDIAYKYSGSINGELFYFDPNTLQQKGWEKLGLRSKTIAIIQNYLSKGGKFRHAEDLGKIYSLQKNELERLMPYVKISSLDKDFNINLARKEEGYPNANKFQRKSDHYSSAILDINTADTIALIALPGIGSKLAQRIFSFREKLGAFYSVDQLSDVYGLPDSTFQKLKPRLAITPKEYKLININSADVNELKQFPYLKWSAANAIVEFRRQHGRFNNLDELLQINLLTPEMVKKMVPYFTVE